MDIAFVVQEHPDLSLAESSPWVRFAAESPRSVFSFLASVQSTKRGVTSTL